ncbi:hypothetical protein [Lactobacillus phage Lbab1]|nr:hypothetical protein [Lactobacillus phage Lbab1]
MDHQVVFKDKDILVFHIYSKLDNPTMLKVQKSLYFLWAYYAGTYGSLLSKGGLDISKEDYPESLFKGNFKALMYGPVDTDVLKKQKENFYSKDKWKGYTPKESSEIEVMGFVNDLLGQINAVNDFGLINRCHEDNCWKQAYENGRESYMDLDAIRKEYQI